MSIHLKKIKDKYKKHFVFDAPIINTNLKNNVKLIFADATASGRPSPIIEKYIYNKILPYYSNTHSNAYCGILMKNLIGETKEYIRKYLSVGQEKKIIFTGSGTTGAINHLIHCLNFDHLDKVNIFITIFEHHSNYLPWIELSKKYPNKIRINIIPLIKDNIYDIDLQWLEDQIKVNCQTCINIISITACSNVLGILNDVPSIYNMINKYNDDNKKNSCCLGKRNLLFVDYACAAPYTNIDGNYSDALFFSPHKFLGGVETPGVLVANKLLFNNEIPFTPGGGCVEKVCATKIIYSSDIEKKESAGTPNIIGIIKIKKILEVKVSLDPIISYNESAITKYIFAKFKEIKDLIILMPDTHLDHRLPIICIAVKNIHCNLIVALLSDLFGIQTRGGVSCTGLLVDHIKKLYNITGWVRITFNYMMDIKEIDFIIDSVKYIIKHNAEYKKYYKFNEKTNLFTFIK